MAAQAKPSEGPVVPGANPNLLNAKPRQNARPKTKNSPNGNSNASMKLAWIDPLPTVDTAMPLGLEPNPEHFPAGEIELDFELPKTISNPFSRVIQSVGDRLQMVDEDKDKTVNGLNAISFFKASRQLYSTMLDVEKSINQPLKAVYYDETPIPSHMGAALGIIGHIETKVGKVLIRHASTLFKRWIARGLQESDFNVDYNMSVVASGLVWPDNDGFQICQELARAEIESLTDSTYTVQVSGTSYTVSMPKLRGQNLGDYYRAINNDVPQRDRLRDLVSLLQANFSDWSNQTLPNSRDHGDALGHLGLSFAEGSYTTSQMRESFEDFMSYYITEVQWRVDSLFKTGPPPAGPSGYGAQTVSSSGNRANWQFPLSDADVNIGFLFSPNQSFNLFPRLVGYSRRRADDAASGFALQDGKPIVN